MRRSPFLPATLALVTATSAVLALRSPDPPRPTTAAGASLRAPMISPRRAPAVLAAAIAESRLNVKLAAALANPDLGASPQSCLIVERGGRVLFEERPDASLIPASTMKVLTAIAALVRLTADPPFVTTARAEREPADGLLDGPLWVVGGGDPLLATDAYALSFKNQPQVYTRLEALADRVAASVREIRGSVIGDESRYDRQRYIPSWKPGYRVDGDVGPQSALAVNDGFVDFTGVHAGAAAPAIHAAAVFTELLQARGVTVTGEPAEGQAPKDTHVVATLESLPLKDIVGEMLTESDNNTAELLTKELGRRFGKGGTTAAGLAVIRETLADQGFDVDAWRAVDGSGLDRSDRLSCDLLRDAFTARVSRRLFPGLAVAGRTGTLADRFQGNLAVGRLRAKSGALDGVVGLAGYVEQPDGAPILFAMLVNGLPVPSEARGRRAQERLGSVLASFPEAPPPDELAP